MSAAAVFTVVNALPLPIWAVWILAPRSALARRLARSLWPWTILAGAYVVTLVLGFAQMGFDPTAFNSLAGVMRLFTYEWVALAGWIHYLCFDLFVARWIMNDAPDAGYALAPILFFTLMAGPLGLLLHLAVRDRWRGDATSKS
jgi:hypothetical protein